ncbi:MAG: tetratricopeptide repeat protein [Flavobacteriaceae bacterium]|nr:tetratricopeptide repeat protein [Flavobacteriaceae bacterium]NNK60444.1 tetratricopeptide repeat protein [Flavobacteriaceae bacterium]RZW49340.1 MAG: tetratricopeptide repeat protein [Flavobacteriaceae bacterium]
MKILFKYNSISFNCLFLVMCFFMTTESKAQPDDIDVEFNSAIHTVVNSKPSIYNDLENLFGHFKRDSLKMKRLAVLSESISYPEGESYALIALGNIYRDFSEYDKAIEFHTKAEELAIIADNVSLRIISLNMLGVDYRRMDIVPSALNNHAKALTIASSVEDPSPDIKRSEAVSLNSMGNIYLALKQYDLALIQFNESLNVEIDEENKLGLAINYHNIGYAKEGKGLLDEALKDYSTSLKYNNEIDSEIGRSICYNSIGEVYIKKEMYSEGVNYIKKALEKAIAVQDQFYIATSYASLGWGQSEMGEMEDAEKNLNLAIEIAQEYNLKSTEVEARNHLAELSLKKKDYQKALNEYQKAINLEKTITNERNLNYINDFILKYENDRKSNTIKALTSENEIVKSRLEKFQLFLLLGALAMLLSVILFAIYNRNKKLQQEKKILTLEQDMLRSQMNPHFIFNSLNSIKLYIINNEKENAVYYLNKFAKLIRKILIATSEKDIQLSDELETMSLYMNIENIRFANEIDFKITIAKNVNPESIRVPSLILQPFLENALWHGLSSKKENKIITLDVSMVDSKYVTIEITDNGVGRKASAMINNNKTLKRKSVGINLTKERLENFSKGYNSMYNIEILDLYDENNKPNGTKVVLDIPIRSAILESA